MCLDYKVPPIHVIIKSKKWVEWFAGLGTIACAFAFPEDDHGVEFSRFIAFDGMTCRISGKDRNIPIKIKHRYQVAIRIHTIIHEFIHHYFMYQGMRDEGHGKNFRKMERKINAEYGIYFFYASNNYGIWFHNFWGFPFGRRPPTSEDRGWENEVKT
uniref:SprT-like domain-containing protein n=1 Tax=uncultured archaeon MedDCM-OCT-S04-C163 TaxID=743086 RepID=D6PB83_9ARCH|nr:hypothetical protein [uncultured archaeon MedDCM-OCT-S04-C163]